ncbi:MAG TPA: fused MFS/spermidine synthase, partial [Tepidisphaeraceae bacterium]
GGAMGLVICAVVAVVLIGTVGPPPPELVAYGRYAATRIGESDMLYLGEGMNSTIAVTKLRASDVRNFHVSGKIEASTEPQDMRLQRMLGVIPSLLHPKPESVLVVGCGAGVTAGSFVPHPDVKRIVLCEIEPLIPEVVAKYFSEQNYDVVTDPRVQIVNDDARHFVLTTPEKFDIITSDPIHPWVKGSATLYTKEYFEMCKQHLNPGGIVTQWVPLYESNLEAVKSEIATFLEVFPEGTVWSNDVGGEGYDLVLLGCAGEKPMQIDVDQLQQKLTEPRFAEMAEALREVGFMSGIDVLATFAAQGSDLRGWLADAQINRDRNLRLQYLAGMGLNASHSGELIYDQLIRKRKFPDQLFVASDRRLQTLRFALEGPPTTQTTKQ